MQKKYEVYFNDNDTETVESEVSPPLTSPGWWPVTLISDGQPKANVIINMNNISMIEEL